MNQKRVSAADFAAVAPLLDARMPVKNIEAARMFLVDGAAYGDIKKSLPDVSSRQMVSKVVAKVLQALEDYRPHRVDDTNAAAALAKRPGWSQVEFCVPSALIPKIHKLISEFRDREEMLSGPANADESLKRASQPGKAGLTAPRPTDRSPARGGESVRATSKKPAPKPPASKTKLLAGARVRKSA